MLPFQERQKHMKAICEDLCESNVKLYEQLRVLLNNKIDFEKLKDEYYDQTEVSYTLKPARMLKIFAPRQMMAQTLYDSLHVKTREEHRKVRNNERFVWLSIAQSAMDKALDMGYFDEWVPFAKVLTIITSYEAGDSVHYCIDNITVDYIQAALRRVGFISDTIFGDSCYFINNYVVSDKDGLPGTGITVIEAIFEDMFLDNLALGELING